MASTNKETRKKSTKISISQSISKIIEEIEQAKLDGDTRYLKILNAILKRLTKMREG